MPMDIIPPDLIRYFLQFSSSKCFYFWSRASRRFRQALNTNYLLQTRRLHLKLIQDQRYGYSYTYWQWPSMEREGPERSYYPNSNLATETYWKSDLMNGPFRAWYPDGNLEYECYYQNGLREGAKRKWHPDGSLFHQSHWRADHRNTA
jgi:hypothetical protein